MDESMDYVPHLHLSYTNLWSLWFRLSWAGPTVWFVSVKLCMYTVIHHIPLFISLVFTLVLLFVSVSSSVPLLVSVVALASAPIPLPAAAPFVAVATSPAVAAAPAASPSVAGMRPERKERKERKF